jgi:hypothetical protein
MELESSSLHSHELATLLYPEPDKSCPNTPPFYMNLQFNIILLQMARPPKWNP